MKDVYDNYYTIAICKVDIDFIRRNHQLDNMLSQYYRVMQSVDIIIDKIQSR